MITAIIGALGSGKTATATHLGHLGFLSGDLIVSNYPLKYEHLAISHPAHLLFISELTKRVKCNTKVLLDEGWRWISSSISQSKAQMLLAQIYTRSRKEDWDLIYTSQRFMNVHIRLRQITDCVLIPVPQPFSSKVPEYFKVSVTDVIGSLDSVPFTFMLEDVADLFDTKSECYGYEDLHLKLLEQLADEPIESFFTGKTNKEEEDKEE